MTNDNRNDDTPKNPLVHEDPQLAAAGMGAIEMSPDDLMMTAAACVGMADACLKSPDGPQVPAAKIARLYQIAAAWLRVIGMTSGPVLDYEQKARDVLATAAASDLDRIRTAGAKAH